jgi:hypothetical protein
VLPNPSWLSSLALGWQAIQVQLHRPPPWECPEHTFQQHVIFASEFPSAREIGAFIRRPEADRVASRGQRFHHARQRSSSGSLGQAGCVYIAHSRSGACSTDHSTLGGNIQGYHAAVARSWQPGVRGFGVSAYIRRVAAFGPLDGLEESFQGEEAARELRARLAIR